MLDKVLQLADYQALRREQAAARAAGRLVGISVVNTVEPGVFDWNAYATVGVQGIGVPEGARVSVDILGNITIVVGFNLQGQGQFTVAAQVAADYFGVDMSAIKVTMAPTDSAPPHFGQGGSRLGVAVTGAVLGACQKLAADCKRLVAHLMGGLPDDAIELMDGRFRIKANPEVGMTLAEVAGTMLGRSDLLPPGMEPNPTATSVWTAPGRTVPDEQGRCRSYLTAASATHVVMVEVDRETGRTSILKYFIVDDCGTRLNPANVEGQLQGAVAQGVGAALLEEYVYDDDANPLVTTFADYGAAIDGTPDADLPDPKSVPVEVPILVEEAKNSCTMGMLLCLDRKQRLVFTFGEILGASDTVGGEVLEMTADNFRQCLTRARRDHATSRILCALAPATSTARRLPLHHDTTFDRGRAARPSVLDDLFRPGAQAILDDTHTSHFPLQIGEGHALVDHRRPRAQAIDQQVSREGGSRRHLVLKTVPLHLAD